MLSLLKSTHAFKQKFFSRLDKTALTSNSSILPLTMELFNFHLGLKQLKDRTMKSSTMSQALCSTIILKFCKFSEIKLRALIV
jgi:hypothetical protein